MYPGSSDLWTHSCHWHSSGLDGTMRLVETSELWAKNDLCQFWLKYVITGVNLSTSLYLKCLFKESFLEKYEHFYINNHKHQVKDKLTNNSR